MRPIILDYQPECRLGRMSPNMSPFSPSEMHDSNDIPTSVSLTFLKSRLRLTPGLPPWALDAAVGKIIDMLDGAWWRGLVSAAQQIGFSFFTFSQWYHPPPTTHLSHSTQFVTFFQTVGRIGATLTVLMCSSGSQTRNCLQFLQYYLYISHCQSSLSTPLPSKEEKLLKTRWYCLALTMTYYMENIYLELKVLLF